MMTTCMGCGLTDDTDLYYWSRDREGNFWHRECRRQELQRQVDLLNSRPIKERHDGATTTRNR
jgi:hypothetical protein